MSGYHERMEMLKKQRQSEKSYYERICDWYVERIVRRGATELEKERPGSVGKLDLKILNIASSYECALGQTYGHFNKAPSRLEDQATSFGFNYTTNGVFHYALDITPDRLNRTWREVAVEYGAKPVYAFA